MTLRQNLKISINLGDPVDVYINRSLISCWGLEVDMWWQWRRPLEVCSLDLVIYCHVFTNPSGAKLGGDKYWQIAHYCCK